MFNISESQKKVLSIWAIIACLIFALVILLAITVKREKENVYESITAKNSNELIDRNRYYTIKSAITKYYSYLNMKDYDAVLKILDENYKDKNNITKNNLKNYLTDTDKQLSYESKVMCLKSIKKGVYTFVTEGTEIASNTGDKIGDKYYQITMNGNTSLFSLMPIDKSTYQEVCNEKA
ncbi:MAG: hypothetical protein J1F35_06995 [Erysipelotrichales bacterium]|nr:hypothetical protein [Erysipelotrichales bacterium]